MCQRIVIAKDPYVSERMIPEWLVGWNERLHTNYKARGGDVPLSPSTCRSRQALAAAPGSPTRKFRGRPRAWVLSYPPAPMVRKCGSWSVSWTSAVRLTTTCPHEFVARARGGAQDLRDAQQGEGFLCPEERFGGASRPRSLRRRSSSSRSSKPRDSMPLRVGRCPTAHTHKGVVSWSFLRLTTARTFLAAASLALKCTTFASPRGLSGKPTGAFQKVIRAEKEAGPAQNIRWRISATPSTTRSPRQFAPCTVSGCGQPPYRISLR